MEISINSAYLFRGLNRALTLLGEETYITEALNTQGVRYGALESKNVEDMAYVSRWPENKFPLKVYMEAYHGSMYDSDELQELMLIAQKALCEIEYVNPELFQFLLVPTAREADIIIRFKRAEHHEYSHCSPELGEEKQIKRAEILLSVPRNYSPEWVLADVVHNLLHAMGIHGHSNENKDCGCRDYQFAVQMLSHRDVQTLQLLYRCPLAMTCRELLTLWEDYQKHYLSLPLNGTLERIINNVDYYDPVLKYNSGILIKSGDLSQREVELQRIFNHYLERIYSA